MARGSDKNLYGVTYPHAKLIRYDPTTRRGEDLGRMSATQMYAHYIAADDDGFLYIGIGPGTHNDLVAYEVSSGRHQSILPAHWQSGSRIPRVYPGTDGCVYAMFDGEWRILRGWNSTATPGNKQPTTLKPGWPNRDSSGSPDFDAVPPLHLSDGQVVSYDGRTVTVTNANGTNFSHPTG